MRIPTKNHDAILLNVYRDASESDIKSAFRLMAKKTHPDTNRDDPRAAERFRIICEAYERLLASCTNAYQYHDSYCNERSEYQPKRNENVNSSTDADLRQTAHQKKYHVDNSATQHRIRDAPTMNTAPIYEFNFHQDLTKLLDWIVFIFSLAIVVHLTGVA